MLPLARGCIFSLGSAGRQLLLTFRRGWVCSMAAMWGNPCVGLIRSNICMLLCEQMVAEIVRNSVVVIRKDGNGTRFGCFQEVSPQSANIRLILIWHPITSYSFHSGGCKPAVRTQDTVPLCRNISRVQSYWDGETSSPIGHPVRICIRGSASC